MNETDRRPPTLDEMRDSIAADIKALVHDVFERYIGPGVPIPPPPARAPRRAKRADPQSRLPGLDDPAAGPYGRGRR